MRVNAFPNAKALPLHAGIATGIFERRGFKIELHLTESSRSQRESLAAGKSDVVHSAVDNAVAMIEVAKHDVVIVSGGDSGMNEFFVQPEIKSFADLRGRVPSWWTRPTPPMRCRSRRSCSSTGSRTATTRSSRSAPACSASRRCWRTRTTPAASSICRSPCRPKPPACAAWDGPSTCWGPIRRPAASRCGPGRERNSETIERYLGAYVEALRFVRDPANRAGNVGLLVDKLKLSAREAERTYELLMDPRFGFTPDAAFDREGFRNMLALRAEVERKPGTAVPAPERYVDLSYYERAMQLVGR